MQAGFEWHQHYTPRLGRASLGQPCYLYTCKLDKLGPCTTWRRTPLLKTSCNLPHSQNCLPTEKPTSEKRLMPSRVREGCCCRSSCIGEAQHLQTTYLSVSILHSLSLPLSLFFLLMGDEGRHKPPSKLNPRAQGSFGQLPLVFRDRHANYPRKRTQLSLRTSKPETAASTIWLQRGSIVLLDLVVLPLAVHPCPPGKENQWPETCYHSRPLRLFADKWRTSELRL